MGLTVHFEVLNQLGTPLMYSATLANRPAAGIAGRIFFRTDSPFGIYRDTGSAWDLIAQSGGGTITGSGAATQVAFWNSSTGLSGSNNLFWDNTNNYLGIGTNTPTTALDVHHATNSGAIFNQTVAANNNTINFQTAGSGRWRIGNFYTAGADDFGIFDVVGSTQQLTIVKTTGQTFVGAKTTASGRLVINSATADAHLQVVGANSPSIRIDNAGSGGTQRFVFGLATASNNFIQGSAAGQFCISTQSSGAMLFGMWQTVNASEVMRISTANNLIVGSTTDNGNRFQLNGNGFFDGNIGVGQSPSNWVTSKAIQVLNGSISSNSINNTAFSSNVYFDGTDVRYINTGTATSYNQENGAHSFSTAISGTSNGIVTYQRIITFDTNANVGIGVISPTTRTTIQGNSSNIVTISGTTTIERISNLLPSSNVGNLTFGIDTITGNSYLLSFYNGADLIFATRNGGLNTEAARITATGNLLIGTGINGASKLRIVGLPTNSVGLSSGDVYSNAGILTIVP